MTDEDILTAQMFAEELSSLMESEEELIKMEHVLDLELALMEMI